MLLLVACLQISDEIMIQVSGFYLTYIFVTHNTYFHIFKLLKNFIFKKIATFIILQSSFNGTKFSDVFIVSKNMYP